MCCKTRMHVLDMFSLHLTEECGWERNMIDLSDKHCQILLNVQHVPKIHCSVFCCEIIASGHP